MPVTAIQAPISDTPFINPSPDPRATGPVRTPGQDLEGTVLKKHKGVGKAKQKRPAAAAGSADQLAMDPIPAPKTVVPGPGLQVLEKPEGTFSTLSSVTSPGSGSQQVATGSKLPSSAPDSFVHPVLSDMDPLPDWSDKDSGEEGELSHSEVAERNEEMN